MTATPHRQVEDVGVLAAAEMAPSFGIGGIDAWTTTRVSGSFGLGTTDPVDDVMHRWERLQRELEARGIVRLASATQVHGTEVSIHRDGWKGWLRQRGIDGHVTSVRGTALAVTVADCTPVFIAHPEGGIAALHAGWRGAAARVIDAGLEALASLGFPAKECVVHLGPSICGPHYEVGPEVHALVTGKPATAKGPLDVRAVLADQGVARGVASVTVSSRCTRCHGDLFYSHRGGDAGRQLGIVALR